MAARKDAQTILMTRKEHRIIDSIPPVSPVVHLDTHTPNVIPVVEVTVPLSTCQGQLLSGRPRHTVKTPSYLSQYHCSLARSSCLPSTLDSSSIPSLPSSTPYLISHVLTYYHFTPLYQSYILSYSLEIEPTSFRHAMLSPYFRKATNEECKLWKQIILGLLSLCLQGKM